MSNDYQGELNDRKDDVAELGRRVAVGLGGFAADVGDTAGKIGTKAVAVAKQGVESVQHALSEKDIADLLAAVYEKAIGGIPGVISSVEEFAGDYIKHTPTVEKAAKSLIANQVVKCGTSGFLTGLGGLITLPVAIPANVGSVLYVQMRMVAAVALLGGFDVTSDQVRTLVYACMTGSAIADVLKHAGIKVGEKVAVGVIKKIPGRVLTEINKRIGFRFITKFGTKGIINMGKLVPVLGGFIGAGFDVASTRVIAKNAYCMFIEKEFPVDDKTEVERLDPIPIEASIVDEEAAAEIGSF